MVRYTMFDADTICAVSTAAGDGGIGIIRMSGKDAVAIGAAIFRPKRGIDIALAASHTMHYGHLTDPATGEVIDEVLVSIMRAPSTYTREDVVEINCHGGVMPIWRAMRLLISRGARHAEPGEFTKRAFLNGRIDLSQAEAVMDIIRAKTEMSHRAANEQLLGGISREVHDLRGRLLGIIAGVESGIDFPEEDIETPSGGPLADEIGDIAEGIDRLLSSAISGRVLREGLSAAIVGRPNVGKSSLLNGLLMQDRAIVTEIPGTTRDVLEEVVNICGMPLRVLDTAGIRHTTDLVEREGVKRSLTAIGSADIVLVVLDGSQKLSAEDQQVIAEVKNKTAVAVINKRDLERKLERISWPEIQIDVSCRTRDGLENLRKAIFEMMKQGTGLSSIHVWGVNQRHKEALERARRGMQRALDAALSQLSPEFIALELREALDHMGLIIGAIYTEDILERIFDDYCIGK